MLRNLFDFQNIQLTFRICKKCFKISNNSSFFSKKRLFFEDFAYLCNNLKWFLAIY